MITDTNNKFIISYDYIHESLNCDSLVEEKRTILFKASVRNLLLYKAITGGKDLFNAIDEYKKVFEKILKNGKLFDIMELANKPESEMAAEFSKNTSQINEVFSMLNDTKIDEYSGLTFSDLLYKVMYISAQGSEQQNELIAMPIEDIFDFEVLSDPSLFMQLISTQLHFVEQYRKYEKKKNSRF